MVLKPSSLTFVRFGEKTTSSLASKFFRKFIAIFALANKVSRCLASWAGPLNEMVITFSPRLSTSLRSCSVVMSYFFKIWGNWVTLTPTKPVSFMMSRISVNGT